MFLYSSGFRIDTRVFSVRDILVQILPLFFYEIVGNNKRKVLEDILEMFD